MRFAIKPSVKTLRAIGPLAAVLVLFSSAVRPAAAANRYWIATTAQNWSNTAYWSTTSNGSGGSAVPTSLDTVYFDGLNGHTGTCTINANAAASSITIGGAVTVTQSSAYTVTVGGAFTQSAGTFTGGSGAITVGSLALSGTGSFTATSGTLTISGSAGFAFTGGAFNASSGTVSFSYAGSQPVAGATYNNLTIGGGISSVKTLSGPITVNGALTISSSTTLNTSASNYGVTLKGNFTKSGTFTANASPITIGGTGTQTIGAFATTGSVTASNTGTATLGVTTGGALTVSGAGGTLALGGSATFTSVTLSAGAFNGGSSALTISGSGGFVSAGGAFNAGTGTVTYSYAGSQPVAGLSYYNLTISGGSSSAKTLSGPITVNGALTISSSTILDTSAANSYAVTLNGSFTNSGTFTANSGTVTYGLAGAQTVGAAAYYNLIIGGGSSSTKTLGGSITVNGDLTINASTTLNTSASNRAVTLNGSFTNGGTFTANGSAITIGGVGTQSIAGFTTTGTVSMTKTGGTATFTGNVGGGALTIAGSGGTLNLGTGLTHTFSGNVTLTSGALNGGSSTLNANSSTTTAWGGTGSNFTAGTGTVVFGGGAQRIATATTFNNLTLSGSSTKTLTAAIAANGDLIINSGVTLATGNYGLTFRGNFTNSGTALNAGSSPITISGAGTQSIAAFTTTGAVAASNTGAATLGATSGGALTVSGANGKLALGGASTFTSINISGATSLLDQNCSYNLTSAGAFTISGQYTNCGAGTSSGNNLTSGAVTVSSGGIFSYIGTGTITLTGNVSNSGTLQIWGGSMQADGSRPACNASGGGMTLTATAARTWSSSSGTFVLENINATYQGGTLTGVTCYGCVGTAAQNDTGFWRFATSPTACVGAPTLVTLNSFTATQVDGGVMLQWKSGREVGNLGYHVYRDGVRMTSSPVAGSALLAGARTVLTAGGSYSWFDPEGTALSSYTLEDVDIRGGKTMHGPVRAQPGVAATRLASRATASRATSPLLGRIGRTAATAPSMAPATNAAAVTSAGSASVEASLAAAAALKLSVTGEGWYHVDAAQLVAAGMPATADPRRLQLFAEGEEQAIVVLGTGRVSAIEFYGTGIDSAFTATRVYWLTWNGLSGDRARTSAAAGSGEAPASFQSTLQWQPRTVYFPALINGDEDNYFGPVLDAADPVTQDLPVTHLARGSGSATLTVKMQGASDGAHAVLVSLNGTDLGTVSLRDLGSGSAAFPVLNSLLKEGNNELKLATYGAEDVSAVDTVTLSYPHSYTADDDYLRFTAQAGSPVTVGGFSGRAIEVVDITDAANPVLVEGSVSARGSGYAVTFGAAGTGVRTLLALTQEKAAAPAGIAANQPSSWKGRQPGGDMVIISHRAFIDSLGPLVKLRQASRRVAVVDVEDLYDEFNFGEQTPYAIRDFLKDASSTWVRKPKWVLLVGDGNYDPRNYLQTGATDWMPVQLVETSTLETASDDWFADFDGDGVAEMAVGRLPVNSPADAATLVNRIVAYEKASQALWKQKALLVAGADDADNPFSSYMAAARGLLPRSMAAATVLSGKDPNAAEKVLAAINEGVGLVDYAGHGSQEEWAGGLMSIEAANALTNSAATPFVMAMACLNGYFQDVWAPSLAEAFLSAPNGGAVAVWASSGMTNSGPQAAMNQAMIQALLSSTSSTIGDAALAAKRAIGDQDARRTWVLLGDPAMGLR
jgi:hypothetical protein